MDKTFYYIIGAVLSIITGLILWYIKRAVENSDKVREEVIKSNVHLSHLNETVKTQSEKQEIQSQKIDAMGLKLERVITKQDTMEKTVDGIVRKLGENV